MIASVGSLGAAYDNAMAESFVDSFKTELISDRGWRSTTQLEFAVVEYVAWFNTRRIHSSIPKPSARRARSRLARARVRTECVIRFHNRCSP